MMIGMMMVLMIMMNCKRRTSRTIFIYFNPRKLSMMHPDSILKGFDGEIEDLIHEWRMFWDMDHLFLSRDTKCVAGSHPFENIPHDFENFSYRFM